MLEKNLSVNSQIHQTCHDIDNDNTTRIHADGLYLKLTYGSVVVIPHSFHRQLGRLQKRVVRYLAIASYW